MNKSTLFQLGNLLGRKQVSKNVFAAKDLLAVTTQGHVICSRHGNQESYIYTKLEYLHLSNGESISLLSQDIIDNFLTPTIFAEAELSTFTPVTRSRKIMLIMMMGRKPTTGSSA